MQKPRYFFNGDSTKANFDFANIGFDYVACPYRFEAVYRHGFWRSISFAVIGRYEQVRQMIGFMQASPEFLIVEAVSFRGEQEAMTRDIRISIKVATVLATANAAKLRLLISGSSLERVAGDKVHADG